MDGQTKCCGVSFNKNEILISSITDKPWKHYAKWKKQVTKDHYCMIPFIWTVYYRQIPRLKLVSGCLGLGMAKNKSGCKVSFGGDKNIPNLDYVNGYKSPLIY